MLLRGFVGSIFTHSDAVMHPLIQDREGCLNNYHIHLLCDVGWFPSCLSKCQLPRL